MSSTVLGLVGRDLLLNTLSAVADEDAAAAFSLAGRAVEMGYDLRLVCRELSRVVRDLLVLSVDPSRVSDPEIAGEGERDRLLALAERFSREDLLRAFDLLTKAEADIRNAAQPRYHLEMALLRWIHLRKLMPIEELIQSAGSGGALARPAPAAPTPFQRRLPPPWRQPGPPQRSPPGFEAADGACCARRSRHRARCRRQRLPLPAPTGDASSRMHFSARSASRTPCSTTPSSCRRSGSRCTADRDRAHVHRRSEDRSDVRQVPSGAGGVGHAAGRTKDGGASLKRRAAETAATGGETTAWSRRTGNQR